jgi:6-phosphofructokinase 2
VARVASRLGWGRSRRFYPVGGSVGELLRRLVDAENIRSVPILVQEETRKDFTAPKTATGSQPALS